MKEPTNKQISFAEKIAWRCNKELPKEFTSKAYWQFIKDNITKYECTFDVNDYNDGIVDPTYVNGIIDCSDLDIYPWGNS